VPSLLRLLGFVIAIVALVLAVWIGRRGGNRSLVLPLVMSGTGLLVVVLFPDGVRLIQGLLGLEGEPAGGIITSLLIALGFAFLLVFYALAKVERQTQRVGRLIRALSAAQLEVEGSIPRRRGILVVVPAWNEAESLPGVLAAVPSEIHGMRTQVLVVDDASRDGTRRAALEAGAHVVTHPVNGGQGAALQTGYLVAERIGVDIVVTMDADGQHDPAQIERLVGPIVRDEADFVVGSRRQGEYDREEGAGGTARNVGITLYTGLMNLLGGTDVSDVANGFRAIRASRLAEIVFTEDQFHNPELLIGAARSGLRIAEVPITILRRTAGTSKKGGTLRYGLGFLRVVIRTWLR
jgi:HAMP domain-containing protein